MTTRAGQGGAIAYGEFGVFSVGDTVGGFPGETRTHPNNKDTFVSLHDENGKLRWVPQFGKSGSDSVNAIAAYMGGFLTGGVKNGTSLPLEAIGDLGMFAMKLAPPPVVFWAYLNNGSNASSTSIGPGGKVVTTLGGTAVTVNNVPAPSL